MAPELCEAQYNRALVLEQVSKYESRKNGNWPTPQDRTAIGLLRAFAGQYNGTLKLA